MRSQNSKPCHVAEGGVFSLGLSRCGDTLACSREELILGRSASLSSLLSHEDKRTAPHFMNTSIILAIALAFGSAALTNAETAAPTKSATAEAKPPAGVAPKLSSTDPEYGYSQKKPIKVGAKDEFGGPAAERAYLNTLRDEEGKPVIFKRLGSFGDGPDGNVLDGYEVQTSTGRKLTLYIDMYHPKSDPAKQLAPKGLFKAK